MRRLTSAREVVDVLGGIAAVCQLTGARPKAAYHWTGSTGMFPARAYDVMTRALRKRKCTAPARLWNQIPVKTAA